MDEGCARKKDRTQRKPTHCYKQAIHVSVYIVVSYASHPLLPFLGADRVGALSFAELREDLRAAGLAPETVHPVRFGLAGSTWVRARKLD